MISRATVYNTLNLFAEKGLVRDLHLSPDSVVFDANTGAHHHFIDEETGRIYDIPAHPYAVAMEAVMLAPNAEVSMFPWKEPKERIPLAVRQIRSFLRAHHPASA